MRLPSFRQLSIEQDKIYNLPLTNNYLVSGPPGTGKTVIALYRASLYGKKGKTPVLISYSKLLSSYTGGAAKELDIDGKVFTYNSWISKVYWSKFKTRIPELEPFVYDWEEIKPQLISASISDSNKPCLLIDEGQDLPPDFYTAASFITENLTVFADENQRISNTQSTFEDIRNYGGVRNEYRLTKNYRNTLEIAKVAACFYAGLPTGKPELPTRRGPLPVVLRTKNSQDMLESIIRYERNNSHYSIGVFCKTGKQQEQILNKLEGKTKNPVEIYLSRLNEMPDFNNPGIKLINFQSAKGLEFDTVFIPDLENVYLNMEAAETLMLFYVLLSRARNELYLTYSGYKTPEILRLIPDELIEKRNQ